MAQTFKNASAAIGTAITTVYTTPSATTTIVIGAQVANLAGSIVDLDFYWTDSSNSGGTVVLGENIEIPAAAAYEPIGGKLVLETGDTIIARAEAASSLEATVSVLELS
jgi:hypothetical protein